MLVKIGELAKKAGCRVVTVRYYESRRLLPSPPRSGGNYRLYDEGAVERLKFIRTCRMLGMHLSEIRDLLAFQDRPAVSCDWINGLVEKHIAHVKEQIHALAHLQKHLEELLRQCSGGKHGECGILDSLRRGKPCPYCEKLLCGHDGGLSAARGGG